jgi:hypothetical protein
LLDVSKRCLEEEGVEEDEADAAMLAAEHALKG